MNYMHVLFLWHLEVQGTNALSIHRCPSLKAFALVKICFDLYIIGLGKQKNSV